ncbi:hypothetical protein ACW66K_01875 [Aerococcus urinaeequi]|uniref:Bacteriocin transport accessory protein n=1 Tax=Aerococcus viridans TaxID=1377 RepID=A0A2N6UCP5_9LACT|nr:MULTISPECIES: hypothetical protein [Aerococcus]OFU52544.1 hypothetical protein HMPREF3116_01785 [Aerococcus sp. HMSC10H05]PMC79348.1 hypothetical protein CJ191_07050 [Aerococcus viridans]
MLKKYAMLLIASILVSGCANTSNNEQDTNTTSTANDRSEISTSDKQVSSQSFSTSDEEGNDTEIEFITINEIEEKIAAGDSFFVFVPGASDEENNQIERTILETYDMIGDQLTDVYPEGEGYTYILNPSEDTDAYNKLLTDYQLEDQPALIYIEGQVYTTVMNEMDTDMTKEDISRFIAFPYDEEDVTTAPDTKIDEDEN